MEPFLDVNEADRVIEIFTQSGKRVCRDASAFLTFRLEIVLDIEINNFPRRRHDIADHTLAQIEHG